MPKYNVQTETDGESASLTGMHKKALTKFDIGPHQQIFESDDDDNDNDDDDGQDDVPSYGFPHQRRNRREPSDIDLIIGNYFSLQ